MAEELDHRVRPVHRQGRQAGDHRRHAPTLGVSISSAPELQAGTTLRSGRLPSWPRRNGGRRGAAEKHGFAPGDEVKVLLQGPARTFTVSGVIGFGSAGNLGGATLAGFTLPTAQEVLNREGRFDEIDVVAAEHHPEALRDRIQAAIDPRYETLTTAKAVRGRGRGDQRHLRPLRRPRCSPSPSWPCWSARS